MKPIYLLLPLCLLGFAHAELSRESGAIYLEDFIEPDEKVVLRVIHPAPCYYQSNGKRRMGTLKTGQDAEIVAITDRAYQVRAKAQHADVLGWVSPKAFQAHNGKDFVSTLKELHKRQQLVNELIAKKQVALGMTVKEVKAALGEPDRISQVIDAGGQKDSLEYVTFDKVLQPVTRYDEYGTPYRDYAAVKVETGKTTIDLTNKVVSSIHNTEGVPRVGAGITIPVRPLLVF